MLFFVLFVYICIKNTKNISRTKYGKIVPIYDFANILLLLSIKLYGPYRYLKNLPFLIKWSAILTQFRSEKVIISNDNWHRRLDLYFCVFFYLIFFLYCIAFHFEIGPFFCYHCHLFLSIWPFRQTNTIDLFNIKKVWNYLSLKYIGNFHLSLSEFLMVFSIY